MKDNAYRNNAYRNNVVRSVTIHLELKITNLPDMTDTALTARIKEMADTAGFFITDPTPADLEIDYTLQIKHLADHLIRSFHPTPF